MPERLSTVNQRSCFTSDAANQLAVFQAFRSRQLLNTHPLHFPIAQTLLVAPSQTYPQHDHAWLDGVGVNNGLMNVLRVSKAK